VDLAVLSATSSTWHPSTSTISTDSTLTIAEVPVVSLTRPRRLSRVLLLLLLSPDQETLLAPMTLLRLSFPVPQVVPKVVAARILPVSFDLLVDKPAMRRRMTMRRMKSSAV
jgi:hypothetical protein